MQIEIHVSEKNEGTESPWWMLIDPGQLVQMFEGVAEHGEVPDARRVLDTVAFSIQGPYFSREEAEDELRLRRYDYSASAKVWCSSGYHTTQYRMACRAKRQQATAQQKGPE